MKWTAFVSQHSQVSCFEWFSEFLNQNQIANELNTVVVEPEGEIKTLVKEHMNSSEGIRFANELYEVAAELYDINPVQTLTLKLGDALIRSENKWWLRCYTFQALNQLISKYGTHINLDGEVLVIGNGGFARLCASAFIRIGFKKVNISSIDLDQTQALAKDIEKTYFGVRVRAIPSEQLILLPGTHSVMINTLKMTDQVEKLLAELYYFNFLKQGGMVWDLNFTSVDSELTREAHDVGAFTLNGVELTSLTDALWLKDSFSLDIDLKKYTDFLISKIK